MSLLQSAPALPRVRRTATHRAAVITEPGHVHVREVPLPEPGPGQVRVRIEGCGVCASNIPPWQGREWFTYPFQPGQLGHEAWGVVDEVADDVTSLRPGDRVSFLGDFGYAEHDTPHARKCVKLPDSLRGRPVPGEPLGCAVNILKRSGIERGQTIAIVGIGFLGALLTQLAARAGATVIAISRRPDSLEVARRMGARHLVPMDDHWKIIDQVKQLTQQSLCPVVVECVGKQWPLDLAGELCAERGRLVIAGYHQDGPRQVNLQQWNWRGLDVINAHERDERVYVDGIRQAVELLESRQLTPEPLYTHTFPLGRLGEALSATQARPHGFMKALIDPTLPENA